MRITQSAQRVPTTVKDVGRIGRVVTVGARGHIKVINFGQYLSDLGLPPGSHEMLNPLHELNRFTTSLDSPCPMGLPVGPITDCLDSSHAEDRLQSFQHIQVAGPHRDATEDAPAASSLEREERAFTLKEAGDPSQINIRNIVHMGQVIAMSHGVGW